MLLLKQLFMLAHIITAAAWFGMGLRVAAQARTVLGLERDAALAFSVDVGRTVRLMGIFAVLTFVFAVATFGIGITLRAYGGQYHAAMTLIVILLIVQYAMIQPAWKKLQAALDAGNEADAFRKRMAMGVGINHLLWLVMLVLMFWDRLQGGFSAVGG